jgi:glycosyltransferase involved in cell wall biosynthesis
VKQRHQPAADTSPPARIGTERALTRSVARIIATCSEEVSELREMGAAPETIDVIPCGVDTSRFRPREMTKPLPQQPFRLLSIGRLVPREGVVDAIEALTLLPECELLVAGGPPKALLHHDREAVRLRARAEALGLQDRVTFLGALPREAVPELIASVHAVVCLPWYEPFGIVPLEAMASGVPVVGSAVGGLLDTVEDGRTGFLVPPRSPHSAGRAVRRLVDSELLRQALGRAGRAAAVAKYDWSRVAEATEASYAAVLGRQHGAIRARRGVPRLGGPRVAMAGQTASVRLEGVR